MDLAVRLEEYPLSDLVRYSSSAPRDAVAFSGTLRKHPYEDDKFILIAEEAGSEPTILEFRATDVVGVDERPSIVDEAGASRSVTRLWVRRGSIGLRYEPFEVDEPLRFRGLDRALHYRAARAARGCD